MNVGRRLFTCSLAVLALAWTGLANGYPFFYPDTSAYVRSADMAFYKLTGIASPWTERDTLKADASVASPPPEDRIVLSGRSPYYGAVLFAFDRTVGTWGMVFLNAVLVLACVVRTTSRLGSARPSTDVTASVLATVVALCAATTLPFYVSELVPDILAPLAIVGCANLLLPLAPSQPKHTAAFWIVLVLFAMVSHTSHFAIVAAILVAALALRLIAPSALPAPRPGGLRMLAVLVVVGAVAEAAMTFAVTKALGAAPVRPPFLTARLIADGTGARFLAKTCPDSGFAACNYANRPPTSATKFLWSFEPGVGAFMLADPPTQRRLSEEQNRLALAVVADAPFAQVKISLENWIGQAIRFRLGDFNYSPGTRDFVRDNLPTGHAAAAMQTMAYRGQWPIFAIDLVVYATFAASMLVVAAALPSGSRWGFAMNPERRLFVLVVLFGLAVNAAVCGILSDPDDRYQARVAWLLPFLALLCWKTRRTVPR